MNERIVRLDEVHALVREALERRDLRAARAICECVLEQCPSDLTTWYLVGRVYLADELWDEACAAFEHVVVRDPDHVKAIVSLGLAHRSADRPKPAAAAFERAFDLQPVNQVARANLVALRPSFLDENGDLPITTPLTTVHQLLRDEKFREALEAASRLVARRPGDSAALLARAESFWRAGRYEEATKACRQVLTRHPLTIKPRLILGEIYESMPDRFADGQDLVESTLVDDVTGVVRRRFLPEAEGEDAPEPDVTVSLPDDLVGRLNLQYSADSIEDAPIANAVESAMTDSDDEVESIQFAPPAGDEASSEPRAVDEPATLADPEILREVLLAISIRRAIANRYGVEGLDRLERRVRAVGRELGALGTALYAVYADDDESIASYGVDPLLAPEPDEIKRVADGILRSIQIQKLPGYDAPRRGILLIGGDSVVPFFRLSNPSDDDDTTIHTDNPYGRHDGHSILTPDLPVGRLPDGSSGTIGFLLRQLDNLVEARRRPRLPAPGSGFLAAGRTALHLLGLGGNATTPFACAASDLETVAGHVVGKVAPGGSIRSSPPIVAGEFDARWLAARRLLHFSLNGRPGGDAWFGQPSRDVVSNDWLLPIALTARGLAGSELAAPVIFSATGYSLDAESENPTRSLSLRFLSEGAAGFVGSTSACYGTNLLPVAGADLLGSLFWEQLRSGLPVGAALQAAKRSFAARALEDQGYLDGDDQKTLLQFVLLGDPLLTVFESSSVGGDAISDVGISSTDLLCNHDGDGSRNGRIDPRTVRAAVEVLALRCPEAIDGAVRIHRRSTCDGQCGQSIHPDDEAATERAAGVTSVTSRTDLAQPDGSHLIRFARATLGADGRIVKTLVSR